MRVLKRGKKKFLGHAVVDGVIRFISPSQIVKANPDEGGCLRRWFYQKVLHIKEPRTKSAETGVKGHSQIERYLKTGEKLLGPYAMAGFRYMPRPGPDLLVEHSIDDTMTLCGIPLIGKMDLFHRRGRTMTEQGLVVEPNTVEVTDWKFTGRLDLMKSGTEVGRATPMLAYGEWISRLWNPERVRLSYVYFGTKKRHAEKRTIILPRDEIANRWKKVEPFVLTMQHAAKAACADDVEPNINACDSFGGCPHREVCSAGKNAGAAQVFGRGSRRDTVSLLKKKPATAPTTDVAAEKVKLEAEQRTSARATALAKLPAGVIEAIATIKGAKRGTPQLGGGAAKAWALVEGIDLQGSGLGGSGELADPEVCPMLFEAQEIIDLAKDLTEDAEIDRAAAKDADELPKLLPDDAPAPDKTAMSQPTEEPAAEQQTEPAAQAAGDAEQPKRGRGRPRKAAAPAQGVLTELVPGTLLQAPVQLTINITLPENVATAIAAAIQAVVAWHEAAAMTDQGVGS